MSDFINEIVELNEGKVIELLKEKLTNNEDPLEIMGEIKVAMAKIGQKLEQKEYFLPDLIMTGEILKQIFEEIGPKLKTLEKIEEKKGKVLLGTVSGDIHDIGKDVVKFMLDINGFEILDLGVDVHPDVFIEKVKVKFCRLFGWMILQRLAKGRSRQATASRANNKHSLLSV